MATKTYKHVRRNRVPFWIDHCRHGPENYLFSVVIRHDNLRGEEVTRRYDVHRYISAVIAGDPPPEPRYCIRYGDEEQDHYNSMSVAEMEVAANQIPGPVPLYEALVPELKSLESGR